MKTEKQEILEKLHERVKELTVLYSTSQLLQQEGATPEILQAVVSSFPAGWQYPEISAARLAFDGVEFTTPNYVSTQWRQRAGFLTRDGKRGVIEVVYLEERPEKAEGPFLAEERSLLDSLSHMLRTYLEHKGAEVRLKESEERFRSAFDNAPIGMALVTPDGRWMRVNRSLCQIVGYSEQELLQTTFQAITHPKDLEADLSFVRRILAGEIPTYQMEKRYLHKHGHAIWILLSVSLLRNSDGEPLYFISQIQDITQRKQAEEALSQTVQRLNLLVEASRAISSSLNVSSMLNQLIRHLIDSIPAADMGAIYLYDPQTERLIPKAAVGFDEEAYLKMCLQAGEGISGRVFETGLSALQTNREDIERLQQGLSPENNRLLRQARRGLGIQSTVCVPLRTPSKGIIGTVVLSAMDTVFTSDDLGLLEGVAAQTAMAIQNADLFEQTRVGEERLRALSHRLVEIQEAERRHIAHELHDEIGQALTLAKVNIQAIGRLAEASALAPELKECSDIVEDILRRVRALSVDLRPSVLDDLGLAAAVRSCVYRYARQCGFAGQVVDRVEGTPLPPAVETTCFRIVQEALTNIVRHARAKKVLVVVDRRDQQLHLLIQDDGVGFDVPEVLRQASGGASLGLLGMQERVSLVEGRIEIKSSPGHGTEIGVRFPLASHPPDEGEERSTRP